MHFEVESASTFCRGLLIFTDTLQVGFGLEVLGTFSLFFDLLIG